MNCEYNIIIKLGFQKQARVRNINYLQLHLVAHIIMQKNMHCNQLINYYQQFIDEYYLEYFEKQKLCAMNVKNMHSTMY